MTVQVKRDRTLTGHGHHRGERRLGLDPNEEIRRTADPQRRHRGQRDRLADMDVGSRDEPVPDLAVDGQGGLQYADCALVDVGCHVVLRHVAERP